MTGQELMEKIDMIRKIGEYRESQYDKYSAEIDNISKEIREGKAQSPWIGKVVWFSDDSKGKTPKLGILKKIRLNAFPESFPFEDERGRGWNYCKPATKDELKFVEE